ncbi:hypothetical protein CCUG60885_00386 [Mycobacteroides salmoniphilum]|uniref:Uncharacterized protein n=2 Tax=Mycobacteroides salmoniphilum TaxID=404941 RepID=A0A4R8SLE4_9MYCO|nr:hypothetical protein CCUG60885_00386 [Mycobacteroides salmoniphilum]TEA03046.1 hypothetical protein CCUG60883_03670 [Mycobacteroides salmoniphilum]
MILTQQHFGRLGLSPNKPADTYYPLVDCITVAEIGCAAADHLFQKHCITTIPGQASRQQDPGMPSGRPCFAAENRDIEQPRARIRS